MIQITKAILGLWLGCSIVSSSVCGYVCYRTGASNVLRVAMQYLDGGEFEGGKAFAINIPGLLLVFPALGGAIFALVSLLVSWRFYKQPLFSKPHFFALFFLAPALAFVFTA